MGTMPGKIQVGTYVSPEVLAQAHLVAARTRRPLYKLIADGIELECEKHLTPAERKVAKDQARSFEEPVKEKKTNGKADVSARTTKRKSDSGKQRRAARRSR